MKRANSETQYFEEKRRRIERNVNVVNLLVRLISKYVPRTNAWVSFFEYAGKRGAGYPRELKCEVPWTSVKQKTYVIHGQGSIGLLANEETMCECCDVSHYPSPNRIHRLPHCITAAFDCAETFGVLSCDLPLWCRQYIINAYQDNCRHFVKVVTGYVLTLLHNFCNSCILRGLPKNSHFNCLARGEKPQCVLCKTRPVARRQPDIVSEAILDMYTIIGDCKSKYLEISMNYGQSKHAFVEQREFVCVCDLNSSKKPAHPWLPDTYGRSGPVVGQQNGDCVRWATAKMRCDAVYAFCMGCGNFA